MENGKKMKALCVQGRAFKQNVIYIANGWGVIKVQRGELLRDSLKECEEEKSVAKAIQ